MWCIFIHWTLLRRFFLFVHGYSFCLCKRRTVVIKSNFPMHGATVRQRQKGKGTKEWKRIFRQMDKIQYITASHKIMRERIRVTWYMPHTTLCAYKDGTRAFACTNTETNKSSISNQGRAKKKESKQQERKNYFRLMPLLFSHCMYKRISRHTFLPLCPPSSVLRTHTYSLCSPYYSKRIEYKSPYNKGNLKFHILLFA